VAQLVPAAVSAAKAKVLNKWCFDANAKLVPVLSWQKNDQQSKDLDWPSGN
jgi:hypothetical protein